MSARARFAVLLSLGLALVPLAAPAEPAVLRVLGSVASTSISEGPLLISGTGVLYLVYAEGPVPGEPGSLTVHRSVDGGASFTGYELGPSEFSFDAVRDLRLVSLIDGDSLLFLVTADEGEERLLALRIDKAGELVIAYREALDVRAAQTSRGHELGPTDLSIARYDVGRHILGGFTVIYEKAGILLQTSVSPSGGTFGRSEISRFEDRPVAYAGQSLWLEGGDAVVSVYATASLAGTQAVLSLSRTGAVVEQQRLACASPVDQIRAELFEDLEGRLHVLLYDGLTARIFSRDGGAWRESDSFGLGSAGDAVEPMVFAGGATYVISGPEGVAARRALPGGEVVVEHLSTLPASSDRAWKAVNSREMLNHYGIAGSERGLFLAVDVQDGAVRLYDGVPASLAEGGGAGFVRFLPEPWLSVGAVAVHQGAAGNELVGYRLRGAGFQELFRISLPDLGDDVEDSASAVSSRVYRLETAGRAMLFDDTGVATTPHEGDEVLAVQSSDGGAYFYRLTGTELRLLRFETTGDAP